MATTLPVLTPNIFVAQLCNMSTQRTQKCKLMRAHLHTLPYSISSYFISLSSVSLDYLKEYNMIFKIDSKKTTDVLTDNYSFQRKLSSETLSSLDHDRDTLQSITHFYTSIFRSVEIALSIYLIES